MRKLVKWSRSTLELAADDLHQCTKCGTIWYQQEECGFCE